MKVTSIPVDISAITDKGILQFQLPLQVTDGSYVLKVQQSWFYGMLQRSLATSERFTVLNGEY